MEVWGLMYDRADKKTNGRQVPYFKSVLIILMLSKPTKPGVCPSADASTFPNYDWVFVSLRKLLIFQKDLYKADVSNCP